MRPSITTALWTRPPVIAAVVLLPLLLLFALLRLLPVYDHSLSSVDLHFRLVTTVAGVALLMALVVAPAARSVSDARTFALSIAFLAMAAFFVCHGLGTGPFQAQPGATTPARTPATPTANAPIPDAVQAPYVPPPLHLDAAHLSRLRNVGLSGQLSLLISALCFAVATIELPKHWAAYIVRNWLDLAGATVVLLIMYGALAIAFPTSLDWLPVRSPVFRWTLAVAAWLGFGLAALRFYQAWRLAALPLPGAMVLGMGLLAEAQLFMLLGPLWHLTWWLYHVAMLGGFLIPVLGLLWHFRHAGDLAVIVESLFLRQTLTGLRAGDPAALTALAAAVAAKDSETGLHTERVAELAAGMGRRLGVSGQDLEVLRWAGRLHDLGKLGTPTAILRKEGPLTADEWVVMRRHAVRGWQLALGSRALEAVAPAILAHHERMDGSGYPHGLRGDEIPLAARIIAVADVWDALTCDRPYRKALPAAEATALVLKETGTRLDQRCVTALFTELEYRSTHYPHLALEAPAAAAFPFPVSGRAVA